MTRADTVASLLALAFAAGCLSASPCQAAAPARPNVVVILIDDHGYGDLSVHGCKDIATPHMDSIAKAGIRCTNGYVSAPQCSPTRAGFMTGRYQQRFGHEYNAAIPDSALSLNETTLAERMKAAGYATGLVGKWHLGSDDKHRPQARGFQEFFGFLGGANPYLPQGPRGVVPRILRGTADANEKEYLTTAFGREAAAFIDRHQKEPFFLYLAFNATHGPMQATDEQLAQFPGIANGQRRIHAAKTAALDAAVGRVLEKLRTAGLEENTLVVFFNDNGGPTDVNASDNSPLRGVKGETREGGIRVPFFVKWPGKLPAGKVYDQPVISLDIHPTVLEAAGVPAPADAKLDGVSLLPYLTGAKAGPPHETLYWRFNFPANHPDRYKWAVRRGDWKLFTDIDHNRRKGDQEVKNGNVKLVNLATDITETHDLSAEHPEKVTELRAAWEKWNAEMAPSGRKARPARDEDNDD
ncbi:MAG TPA: sulfatase [Gemmataceae bacterium]|jgi:arylsulfatase A-like enzyme